MEILDLVPQSNLQLATPAEAEKKIAFRLPLSQLIENAIQTIVDLIIEGHSIVMTLSSGKDSTTTTLLSLEAIRRCAAQGIPQSTHYVSSSSTAVENPEIENALLRMHADIDDWVTKNGLPVETRMVRPHPASKFVVSVVGRGTLPRFVENGQKRSCSTDWKVKPQERLAKTIISEVLSKGFKETVTVLGTRLDESAVRNAAMIRRGEQAQKPVRSKNGYLTLSLIADWTESDVWDFLVMFLDKSTSLFPTYTQGGTIRRMLDLYRDGNEGTCGMFMADGAKAPCGSRFGCSVCTITGDRDKSMESMLNSDAKYEYMRGINLFRNFLIATQWDMSRRELVGRTVSPAGFLPVRPDVYSLQMREDLLMYLLTLDEIERERAEAVAEGIACGDIEETEDSIRMSEPQFQFVSEQDIVLIDFFWSMHHYASSAFPAMRIWYEVKTLGRRYSIPGVQKTAKEAIAPKRWYPVGAFDKEAPADGLRDYKAEMWNPYLHPERLISHKMAGNEKVAWHDEADTLAVDATEAVLFVDTYCSGSMPIETQGYHAIESARFWLNEGIIKLPAGMAGRYQHMAKRAQYFAHLAAKLNLTPEELDRHLEANSISDHEHAKLLGEAGLDDIPQMDLFG